MKAAPSHDFGSGSEVKLKKITKKTELISQHYKSEHKIVDGFWLQGDFFILVTLDRTTNNYYLELYHVDDCDIKDKRLLFKSNDNVIVNIEHCDDRRFFSIFVEEKSFQTKTVNKMTLYILDSAKFKLGIPAKLRLNDLEKTY